MAIHPAFQSTLQCRCGRWRHWRPDLPADYTDGHTGEGHAITRDPFRAPCRPLGGCRWCGGAPAWPKRFYCSDDCRTKYEQNHAWGAARLATLYRQSVYSILPGRSRRWPEAHICVRCGEPGASEVNHIAPVAGLRYTLDCANHLDNLEALCHACHVAVTNEQRAAGLLRRAVMV